MPYRALGLIVSIAGLAVLSLFSLPKPAHADDPQSHCAKVGNEDTVRTRLALRLAVLTFVRTAELRAARWDEVDLEAAEWRIPAERMKMRAPHIVPLSRQAVETFAELRSIAGRSDYVFPSPGAEGCMSNNTMLFAMYRMGFHGRATVHGFRAVASTLLNEMGFHPDWIERQLAHDERNRVRAAYNHAQYLPERRKMMQQWADYLDTLKGGAEVIPLHGHIA